MELYFPDVDWESHEWTSIGQLKKIGEESWEVAEALAHGDLINAIRETLEGLKDAAGKQLVAGIFAAVPYCIDLMKGPYIETNDDVCRHSVRKPPSGKRLINQHLHSTLTNKGKP